jgi:hypothetical protein
MAKKYSILVGNDEIVAVEVDGVRYKTVDEIPDDDDRGKMLLLTESWPGAEPARPFALPKIIVPLFLAVAILMLAIAVISGIGTRRALARQVTAPGRVIELVERSDQSGNLFYHPVVELSLADGSHQTVQLLNGSYPASHKVGDAVTVAYDPQDPSSARIQSTSSTLGMYIVTFITGILGLAFAAATLFARWVMKPSSPEVE